MNKEKETKMTIKTTRIQRRAPTQLRQHEAVAADVCGWTTIALCCKTLAMIVTVTAMLVDGVTTSSILTPPATMMLNHTIATISMQYVVVVHGCVVVPILIDNVTVQSTSPRRARYTRRTS